MEIDTEKAEQAIKELSDAFTKAFMPVAEAIKNISATLCHTFIDTWESIKEKMPDFEKMKISRKRFVKLLNEEKGKYTFLDFIIESNKKEV